MTKRLLIICILFSIAVAACIYALSGGSVSKSALSWTKGISKSDDSSQWFKIKRTKRIKGVALVIHGLNLRPDRMQSIIDVLNDSGIDVLNLSLRGHGNNYLKNTNFPSNEARLDSFRNVTYVLWSDEIYKAYLKVRERASSKNIPVFFIGYSIGGLMGCDIVLSYSDVSFDRMVLFAPAFSVMAESYLLKALISFPNVVIDSLSPISYRANEGTPMSAYKALFEAIDYFEKNSDDRLNKPTIIFIDEKDEFISCSKLREIIVKKNLDRWQIYTVQKDHDAGETISHHLIIDKESLGENMWGQIKDAIKKHLNTGS